MGLAATIWVAIVPALMLRAVRKKFGAGKGFSVFGGTWLMIWVLLFGLANIVAQLLSRAEILPVFKG